MSLLCNPSCRNQKRCACTCTCNNVVEAETEVAGATTEVGPQTVRALLNTVIDSCCTTDDVCKEITFCRPVCMPEIEVGTALDVSINGDITFNEVTRTKDGCLCVSTVRYNIPIRIVISDPCSSCVECIDRNITVIRSAKLCCTANSVLTSFNTQALAVSAVVSEINGDSITVTLCILFRSCLQHTMVREYTWEATPVCESPSCNDARSQLVDPCDIVCGCVAGKICPTC